MARINWVLLVDDGLGFGSSIFRYYFNLLRRRGANFLYSLAARVLHSFCNV